MALFSGTYFLIGYWSFLFLNLHNFVLPVALLYDYQARVVTDMISGVQREITLPESNVLSYKLPGGSGVIVRPSGTEPKIKVYITAREKTREKAQRLTDALAADMKRYMNIEG